jgi:hypothetical protein
MANPQRDVDLERLLMQTLRGGSGGGEALERYLTDRSKLPGTRMNTALVSTFAAAIGRLVSGPNLPPVERLEALLDGWAALSLADAPVNDPREILPSSAVMAYGQVAVARPDWWGDEVSKLHRAASDPRWRVRELVAAALQRMLAANWQRACQALSDWLSSDDPLVIRACAAAIAEPPLLTDTARGERALLIQAQAIDWLAHLPAERRRDRDVVVLRRALGYTVSVAITADPAQGLALLDQLRRSSDKDIRWIVRENEKKQRLKAYLGAPADGER